MSLSWSLLTTITIGSSGLYDVAINPSTGTMFMIAADPISGVDGFTSTDGGATWVVNGAFFFNDGGSRINSYLGSNTWVASAYGSFVWRSTDDATTFTRIAAGPGPEQPGGASDGNGYMIAIASNGGGQFGTTDGGVTWTDWALPSGFYTSYFGGIIWDGTQFVAIARDSTATVSSVWTAPTNFNAVTGPVWTQQGGNSSVVLSGFGANGQQLGYDPVIGYICPNRISSTYGIYVASTPATLLSATQQDPIGSGNPYSCTTACNGFAFISDDHGAFMSSTDGTTWTGYSLPSIQSGENVRYVLYDPINNYFTAFGSKGSVWNAASTATVPNVVGEPQATAEADIVSAGFTVGTVGSAYDPTVPAGDVISQNPVGGTAAATGSPVDIVTSLGPAPASITISPTSATVVIGEEQVFTYSTVSPTDASVTWSALYGTVNNGVYIAPSNLAHTDDFVTVTRMDDGLFATAEVSLVNKTVTIHAGYRSPNAYPPVMLIKVPTINPKIYMPVENTTVVAS